MQRKLIAQISLALAICIIILGVINGKWYLIAAAALTGLIIIGGAIKYLLKENPENLRSFSWHNIIGALSLLSLTLGDFYNPPKFGFVQIILSIVITALGCYTLYEVVTKEKLEIIP